ncbi:exonuclease domain-containing protein [Nocardiopsis sp. FR6]|uniref:exonuclease domain-containing protein n=1 Tax=Nocardiopsis sp. FR6 TaxID=2605986 RepID=UPI0013567EF5|nr:exonuclease domain-containing protein [Nocardiopsis sp. FR6]
MTTVLDSRLLFETPLVFVDAEFTTLDERYRRPWEIAVIRHEDGQVTEHVWMVHDVDLTGADEEALSVGGFADRHPNANGSAVGVGARVLGEAEVAAQVLETTRDAQWVGVVPDADASTVTAMLRRHGLVPGWHYQLIDAAIYAAGALGIAPPRSSWEVSAKLGLPPEERTLHQALEDARWARDLFFTAFTSSTG